MTFDVTKFLALTAVLAGASIGVSACSDSNKDDTETNGGTAGTGGESSAGETSVGGSPSNAAGSSAQTNDGGVAGEGGATVGVAGGAGGDDGGLVGGAAGATAGGAGGEGGAEACLMTDAAYEGDPCATIPETQCDGAEEGSLNAFADTCAASWGANTAVRLAFADCFEGDVCAETAAADAAACWRAAAAKACPFEAAATLCTTVVGTCGTGLTEATCTTMIDTTAMVDFTYVPECMDPNAESYDQLFEGDCKARLAACAGVPAL